MKNNWDINWESFFKFKLLLLNAYPSAHVARHSPLCNWSPLTHSVQFIRDTHWLQVCKHKVHAPASMKYPLSHVFTHLLFCNSKFGAHDRQSFSVGPVQVSHVEWHGWHRPLSKYSAISNRGYFILNFIHFYVKHTYICQMSGQGLVF